MAPKLRMVIFNHIKHKSFGSNDCPSIYKFLKCTNLHKTDEDYGDEVVDFNTSGMLSPQLPFFPELVELVDAHPS